VNLQASSLISHLISPRSTVAALHSYCPLPHCAAYLVSFAACGARHCHVQPGTIPYKYGTATVTSWKWRNYYSEPSVQVSKVADTQAETKGLKE
jgi:hypothetical protein